MRVSLSQRGDEVVGKVEIDADAAFVLEALAATVEAFAKKSGVAPAAIVRDLYSIVCGRVT